MIGLRPTPLDESFRDLLSSVARAHRLAAVDEPAKLAPMVEALTAAYNDPKLRGLAGVDHRAARLGFWFARDVPKMAGALREAIATKRLVIPAHRALRVLDVGAGLGASHRGLARALAAVSARGVIDVTAVDSDIDALQIAQEIVKRRPREGEVEIRLRTEKVNAARAFSGSDRYDVVLLGQVLSELHLELDEAARVETHRELVRTLLARTLHPSQHDKAKHDKATRGGGEGEPGDQLIANDEHDGLLAIVEPSLRPRSRHLQRVRGALIESGARVFAPCLHQGRCPLLGREGDWCHEDLAVDLPDWLVPLAKRAGLRWEGLTFSYLILARGGHTLRDRLPTTDRPIERAVSSVLQTKGKLEVILCGDPLRGDISASTTSTMSSDSATSAEADPLYPHGTRAGRLDREASTNNAEIKALRRGDIVSLPSHLDEKNRVRSVDVVTRIEAPVAITGEDRQDDAQGR